MGRISLEPGLRTIEVDDEVEKKVLNLHRKIRELSQEVEDVAMKVVAKLQVGVLRQLVTAKDMKHVRRRLHQYFEDGYASKDAKEVIKK